MPGFQRWSGGLHVDRDAEITVLSADAAVDSILEEKLHAGVQSFGVEVSRISNELWTIVRVRVHDILTGRVQRIQSLKLRVRLETPKIGDLDCMVAVPAFYQDGNVFVSGLTTLSDQTLADGLLWGLPLSGQARWSAISSLRLHLMSDHPADTEPVDLFDEEELPSDLSDMWDESGDQAREEPGDASKESQRTPRSDPKPPQPPPHPVDDFDVESDSGGDEPSELEGGLEGRRKVQLRRPKKNSGAGDGGGPDKHARKSTEERAVDLFRIYLLEPDGIEITDQRLRAGVGADLVGSDNVYRELKARNGSAGNEVGLTAHVSDSVKGTHL